ncbi:MAG: tetratricopeptide repeat protein [Bacteroidetes bacterium]|nr:tetratricopeptide repeat protein [Bacteroidota bacterium]
MLSSEKFDRVRFSISSLVRGVCVLLVWILLIGIQNCFAQTDPLAQARYFASQKDYDKAIESVKHLYDQNPMDGEVYRFYFNTLLDKKEYKEAEQLVSKQLKISPNDPMLFLDLGNVYVVSGKPKKSAEPFQQAINLLNGDDILTTKMANEFIRLKQEDWAIKTYERAIEIIRNPYFYSTPLAKLYAQTGNIEQAINTVLNVGQIQLPGLDDTKTILLEILGNDLRKLQLAQKALIRKINEQPSNTWFVELLTWLYTQKDDWEGALIQIQALDERNKEDGVRLLDFARLAAKENHFDIAIKALDNILEKGNSKPLFAIAYAEKLRVLFEKLKKNPTPTFQEIAKIEQEYDTFFRLFPQYYISETLNDYATLEAQFAGKTNKAISLLQTAIAQPNARREFYGWSKLQLGDYYLLSGKIWDASLVYSQVDKDFREDMLGEEARFRNAKLAFYQGDFEWAQAQLSVLKASTSELIANDALYLSILITENIPPDSNLVPLRRFAYADLLLFQNKDKEAETLLDSISKAYPKHPLSDDILMLKAQIAVKHQDYNKALNYWQDVYDRYAQDVLADDAIFKTAEVYENYLKQPEKAKSFYEKLILEFPGSTYVQIARKHLALLQANSNVQMP